MDLIFEINALETIKHPNIVKIFAYSHRELSTNSGEFLIIMQHGGRTLKDLVELNEIESADMCLNIFLQICSGVEYMHGVSERYCHRDLKPSNIFVARNEEIKDIDDPDFYTVKIGDLGEMTFYTGSNFSSGETSRRVQGTSMFMAYEVFCKYVEKVKVMNSFYTQSVDIYALSLIFMYMVSGGILPFYVGGFTQITKKIPCLPDYFPASLTRILAEMLHLQSELRPDIKKCRYSFDDIIFNISENDFRSSWSRYKSSLNKKGDSIKNLSNITINYNYRLLDDAIKKNPASNKNKAKPNYKAPKFIISVLVLVISIGSIFFGSRFKIYGLLLIIILTCDNNEITDYQHSSVIEVKDSNQNTTDFALSTERSQQLDEIESFTLSSQKESVNITDLEQTCK